MFRIMFVATFFLCNTYLYVLALATKNVATFTDLQQAITSNTRINIVRSIVFPEVITISGITNLTITSNGNGSITSDGLFQNDYGGLLHITSGTELKISKLTLVSGSAGYAGGCLYATGTSTVWIDDVDFISCSAQMGGGIFLRSKATATITNGAFTQCYASSVSQ